MYYVLLCQVIFYSSIQSLVILLTGLAVGCAPPIKGLLFGADPPLSFLTDSLNVMADAMIPSMMLVLGSVLHKGPGSGKVPFKVMLGILGMRQIVIPFLGKLLSSCFTRGCCGPVTQSEACCMQCVVNPSV